jgi:hypothetical protein
MKKTLKFLALAAVALTLSLSLASCSSDDDDNDVKNSYTIDGVAKNILSAGYQQGEGSIWIVLCPAVVTDNFVAEPAEYINFAISIAKLGTTITVVDGNADGLMYAAYRNSDGYFYVNSGTLRIDDNGSNKFTVTFNFTLDNGKTLSGTYSGVMTVVSFD